MDPVSELKSRLNITDVVRGYSTLVPQSNGTAKCVCPFHDDHHPSMIVDDRKGLAWCFACNTGGDIFGFVQKAENCSFSEAIHLLAEKAGLTLEKRAMPTQQQKDEKERLYDILEEATTFFQKQLVESKKAKKVLSERKLSDEILQKWRVGYAPDAGHSLEKHLLEKKYSHKEMLESGLLNTENRDKFRSRLMFPILNHLGRVCGFGGRYIGTSDKAPKYLNSPQTPVFNKSDILYGLHLSKDVIKEEGFAIVVEGYFDVLACHAAGIETAVAINGVAFTDQHARRLRRFAKTITFALDIDSAGQMATRKSAQIALKNGLKIELLTIPGGKDPDESLRQNKEEFLLALEKKEPGVEGLIARSFANRDPSLLEDKKKILDELLPIIHHLPRDIEKDHYLQHISQKLGTGTSVLSREMQELSRFEEVPVVRTPVRKTVTLLEYFLGMLLTFPSFLEDAKARFLDALLPIGRERSLYLQMKKITNQNNILEALEGEGEEKNAWKVLSLYAQDRIGTLPEKIQKEEYEKALQSLNRSLVLQKQRYLTQKMKESPTEANEILIQLNELNKILGKIHES